MPPRLYVGVLDDEALRWAPTRHTAWRQVGASGASVVRTIVDWSQIARRRPVHARSSSDRAYNFDDLDEYVRWAQLEGAEVLLTLWGTPAWANGGRTPNVPPTRLADFRDFAYAVADRYSGAHPGLPFVRFASIWNEPNAPRFLHARDRVAAYAGLLRAGYRGLKAGSPATLVAAGETSASHSPARFAARLAARFPGIRFDAWAHHPYPPHPNDGPAVRERWPNVGLDELGRFSTSLDRLFGRDRLPIWVTEYAESRPFVGPAQQAADLDTAIDLARSVPAVRMFVWLMLRNHRGEPWQSGLIGTPAFGVFRRLAREVDPRASAIEWGSVFSVPALELRAHLVPGTPIVVDYAAGGCGTAAGGTELTTIGRDGWVDVALPGPRVRRARWVRLTLTDWTWQSVTRTLPLLGRGC